MGLSVNNEVVSIDLSDANTPHLLIAGPTGQGKSECMKSLIGSLIKKNPSTYVKLVLIDPKRVEFSRFSKLPHLYRPIITETEEAIAALEDSVIEMDRRYDLLNALEVNNIDKYNDISSEKLPHIVIIFDEFADFIIGNKATRDRIESAIKKLS